MGAAIVICRARLIAPDNDTGCEFDIYINSDDATRRCAECICLVL